MKDLLINVLAALATAGLGTFAARTWAMFQRYRRLNKSKPAVSISAGDDSLVMQGDLGPAEVDVAINRWLNESLGLPRDQGVPVHEHEPEPQVLSGDTLSLLDPLTIALQELAKAREEITELTKKLLAAADASNKRGQKIALWTAIGANIATMVGLVVTITLAAN